jgi:hypothetical protein
MRVEKCASIGGVGRPSKVVEYQTCPPKSPAATRAPLCRTSWSIRICSPESLAVAVIHGALSVDVTSTPTHVACAASSCQDDLIRLG